MTETEKTSRDLRRRMNKAARALVLFGIKKAFIKFMWALFVLALIFPFIALIAGVVSKICFYAFSLTWNLF